jgi:hypothetical protein
MVRDDQRLDRLARIAVAGRDCLIGSKWALPYGY